MSEFHAFGTRSPPVSRRIESGHVVVTFRFDPPTSQRPNGTERVRVLLPDGQGHAQILEDNRVDIFLDLRDPLAAPHLVLGPALGLALHLRGEGVLHGSAVKIGPSGVGILGPANQGKSTLAATLRRRGHEHLSDGMCVVREDFLVPGPPRAKLWPDSIESIGEDPNHFARVIPSTEKRTVPITSLVATEPVHLSHIFCLQVDTSASCTAVEQLSATAGLWELIRNYYLAEYIGRTEAPIIFERCAAIARSVPVYKLLRPNNLHALDEVAEAVERTVASCP